MIVPQFDVSTYNEIHLRTIWRYLPPTEKIVELGLWCHTNLINNNVNLYELAWSLVYVISSKNIDSKLRAWYTLLFDKEMCLEKSTPA